jgi:hypothetical protein
MPKPLRMALFELIQEKQYKSPDLLSLGLFALSVSGILNSC